MPSQVKSIILVLFAAAVAVVFVWGTQWFAKSRTPAARSSCINGLRQIDGAKQQWAIENKKTTNDIPNWSDVDPYVKTRPTCPDGGTITFGSMDENPKCSIGSEDHVLQ